MHTSNDERSLGDLFAALSRETTTLVRQEMTLARTEMTQTAARVGKDIGFLAAGAAVAYAGFLALVAAVIIVLATVGLPWWLAALIVGVVIAGAGYVLVQRGRANLKQEDFTPRQTVETLKGDVDALKGR
jgi:hypothetical protein